MDAKEENIHAYGCNCFHSFESELKHLIDCRDYKHFERIEYRFNQNGMHDTFTIVGIFSDEDAYKRKIEFEKNEYRILKQEFEPDLEDSRETVRIKVPKKKNWLQRLLKKD